MTTHDAGSEPRRIHTPLANDPSLTRLEDLISDRSSGRVHDVHLSWEDGALTLHGSTRTYHAKQLAQEAVLDLIAMPGGWRFANQIVVG